MFFSRKNKPDGIVISHYEGLPGFRQDFPCNAKISGDMLVFSNNEGKTVNLPIAQIQSVDTMVRERNFMARYHGNAITTSKGAEKLYYVITYTNFSGATAYLAFWDAYNSKTNKFFESIPLPQSGAITL